jgi:hypothetical protein
MTAPSIIDPPESDTMPRDWLPTGTDVLQARVVEMNHHPHGVLTRSPGHSFETALALANRLLGVRIRVAAIDGRATAHPDPLVEVCAMMAAQNPEHAGAFFNLGSALSWQWLEGLAVAVPEVESRLDALEGRKPVADNAPLEGFTLMNAQKAVDGFIHRHEEIWWTTMETTIPRVLSAEVRTSALEKSRAAKPEKAVR